MFSKWHQRFVKNGEPFFCQKAQNVVYFGPYDFVQISPACGPNTYQTMYGETSDFQCQHQQYGRAQHKYPIEKSIFAVHLPYTVANADIGSLKFL